VTAGRRAGGAWRAEARRLRAFARRLERTGAEPPLPPPLPPGRVVSLPGRGETFVREQAGPPGVPTVLLLHGWTASADLNWWRVYDRVPRIGAMLAVDHRGHGRGMRSEEQFTLEAAADDAAALLRHLGTGPAILCGYSMGGPIALLLWQRHPELVRGMVLEATALEWRASLRERLVWKTMGVLEYALRLGPSRGLVERFLRDAVETAPDLGPYRGWLKGELRRGDPGEVAQAGRALGDYDARPFARAIDVPVAVVVTTRDRLVRPRKQRALARAIRGAVTFELAGDHDACLVLAEPFADVTIAALEAVGAGVALRDVDAARGA
jgi:3-oxoadipate enol-lactonase